MYCTCIYNYNYYKCRQEFISHGRQLVFSDCYCVLRIPYSHGSERKPVLKVEGEWNGVMYIKHPNGVSPYNY